MAVQPAVNRAVDIQVTQAHQLLTLGKTWQPDNPASLVGKQPVGAGSWQFSDNSLQIANADSRVYIPLNFDGLRLPAKKLTQLRMEISSSENTHLKFYHRSRLNGPAAESRPIEIDQGHHQLSINMMTLPWHIDGEPAFWGHSENVLATLRIHPARQPADIELYQVSLLPAENTLTALPKPDAKQQGLSDPFSTPSVADRLLAQRFWWSTTTVRGNLDGYRHNPQLWGTANSAATVHSTPFWAKTSAGSWALAMAALLFVFLVLFSAPSLHTGQSPAEATMFGGASLKAPGAMALLAGSLWWCFSQPAWNPWYLTVTAFALLLCVYFALQSGQKPLPPRQSGGSLIDLGLLLLPLVLLFVVLLIADDPTRQWLLTPARWFTYLVWATVQQWLLCRVLYPLAIHSGLSPALATTMAALIFGWAHLPNLELMLLTWVLALTCLWHYRRHQKLLPPIALHVAAGSLLLASTPVPLLFSVSAGPGFWN